MWTPSLLPQLSEFCRPETALSEWLSHGKGSSRLLDEMWHMPIQDARVCSVLEMEQPEASEQTIAERFRQQAAQWKRETGHISSVRDLVAHPAYQRIIQLGWDVVPCLLTDLAQNHGFWLPALAEITGIRPFDPSDAGNNRRMREAWLQWGKRKGMI